MKDLFSEQEQENKRDWEDEWVGMPEYNNPKPEKNPLTATFKFKNQEDFDFFMVTVKEKLYDNKRVFDGKQGKTDKTAWFPLPPRPSENVYINENVFLYPFEEGDIYYTIENNKVVRSLWDEESENMFNAEKSYFKTESQAKELIKEQQNEK